MLAERSVEREKNIDLSAPDKFLKKCSSSALCAMERDAPSGWPLGLENMNMRLRVSPHIEAAATSAEANTLRAPSSSFSSFSSSNLDTESSASFFQDQSVPLGRLIGIRHGDRGRLYFPNTVHVGSEQRLHSKDSQVNEMEMSCGICVPQLCNIIVKMTTSKSSTRQ